MTSLDNRLLSVIIPVFCEAPHLRNSFEEIHRHVLSIPCRCEYLLVDDGSTDGTWDIVGDLCRTYQGVAGIRLTRNFGKEAAISAGIEHARGQAIVVIDADLEHPPALIPEMFRLWADGTASVVEAVRVDRQKQSVLRRWGGEAFTALMNRLSGLEMTGATDFKLLDRRVVDAWSDMPETQLFYRAMVSWLGFQRVQIPFSLPDGQRVGSVWRPSQLVTFAVRALTSFSAIPLQIVSLLGIVFLFFALVLAVRSLQLWMTGHAAVGFSTVILLQLVVGAVVMLSLGVIGHYIGNIYLEVKRRPRYVVSEAVNLTSIPPPPPRSEVRASADDASRMLPPA